MQVVETKVHWSSALLFEKTQKPEKNIRRGTSRIAGCWWWRREPSIDETCVSRNGRFTERKAKHHEKRKKKTPLSCNSTHIRFSCEVPFVDVYAHFLLPPSPTSSSVFFISSLVCTDQNPVNAYEPIERQLGGCHGDTVGGACASRTANLLRFDMGGASI